MKHIGFVGLGMMGAPMARNLQRAGFRITAYDLRRAAVDALVAEGGSAASQLGDLASTDSVIVMVNTDAQAREVIQALIDGLDARPRSIICMSTILPSTIRELGATAAQAGIGVLDAPVSGGAVVAQLGALAIMVGGDRGLFDKARPAFEAVGRTVTHVGPLGAGQALKLVNNMIAISALPAVLEALRIGLQQGLDLTTMVEVIKVSSGNTWLTDTWDQARMFLEFLRQDPAQLDALLLTGRKDMELITTMCAQAGLDTPVLRHSLSMLEPAVIEALRSNVAAIMDAVRPE